MKRRLLSVLVLLLFSVSFTYSIPAEVLQSQESMKNYIMKLETQLQLCKNTINSLEQILQNLEVYKNSITSYNLSTTQLTENEQNLLNEEQFLRKQQETLTQQWEEKYNQVMTQLTDSGKKLEEIQTQLSEAKDLYDDLYTENDSQKKKTTFWKWVSGIASALSFLLGGYLGIQLF